MKLTSQQIAKIEETLVLNGLIYDDIKLEVTDHIASEIEAEMEEKEISFETAFKQAFENWKDQLTLSYSFWTGTKNVAPRIVIEKWESIHRKQNPTIFWFSLFITILIIGSLKLLKIENLPEIATLTIRWFCLTLWIFIVAVRVILWKSAHKTLFGFIFKKRSRVPLNGLASIVIGLFPNRMLGINSMLEITVDFFVILLLMFSISSLKIAYKHFQFERKLSISKL
jgi:hypothetical protein